MEKVQNFSNIQNTVQLEQKKTLASVVGKVQVFEGYTNISILLELPIVEEIFFLKGVCFVWAFCEIIPGSLFWLLAL